MHAPNPQLEDMAIEGRIAQVFVNQYIAEGYSAIEAFEIVKAQMSITLHVEWDEFNFDPETGIVSWQGMTISSQTDCAR